jgi:hypothetical protein
MTGQQHVYEDTTSPVLTASAPVIGYVGHGVNDGPGALEPGYISGQLQFELANGAIFHTWESFNALTFQQGVANGQGLVAEWIGAGGTAAIGQVQEPGGSIYHMTNEDHLFQMMLQGMTFAEAAWSATPQLSYVNTVIGDPLMVWKTAMIGDANLDGMVSISDIIDISNNYNETGATWREGDFNGDGQVTIADMLDAIANYGMIDSSLGSSAYSAASAAAGGGIAVVPEPEVLVVFWGFLLGLVKRRRVV